MAAVDRHRARHRSRTVVGRPAIQTVEAPPAIQAAEEARQAIAPTRAVPLAASQTIQPSGVAARRRVIPTAVAALLAIPTAEGRLAIRMVAEVLLTISIREADRRVVRGSREAHPAIPTTAATQAAIPTREVDRPIIHIAGVPRPAIPTLGTHPAIPALGTVPPIIRIAAVPPLAIPTMAVVGRPAIRMLEVVRRATQGSPATHRAMPTAHPTHPAIPIRGTVPPIIRIGAVPPRAIPTMEVDRPAIRMLAVGPQIIRGSPATHRVMLMPLMPHRAAPVQVSVRSTLSPKR